MEIERVRHPSLITRWLPRDGMVPQPAVAFVQASEFGGAYLPPGDSFGELSGGTTGMLVIAHWPQVPDESTIAHEYRHHMQHWRGLLPVRSEQQTWAWLIARMSHTAALREYYRRNWCELDALRFQLRQCPRDELGQESRALVKTKVAIGTADR